MAEKKKPNATTADARAGYDIYRRAGGNISREDLNARLYAARYGEVSDRTFTHYRNLYRDGFQRYVPINRYDVARAAVPFEGAYAAGRHSFAEADLGVEVTLAKRNKLYTVSGAVTAQSETGAVLTFVEPEVVEGLRKLKVGTDTMLSIRYLESGTTLSGMVSVVDIAESVATIEVQYERLVPVIDLGMASPMPTSTYQCVVGADESEDLSLEVASVRIFQFFELVEGVRSVVNRAASRGNGNLQAEPAELQSLRVASPAQTVLTYAVSAGGLLVAITTSVAKLAEAAKNAVEARSSWLDVREKEREAESRAQYEAAKAAKVAIENEIVAETLAQLRSVPATANAEPTEAESILRRQVFPAITALGESGATMFSVHEMQKANELSETPAGTAAHDEAIER